jgi:HSP20 family molecular chaperone IbpA
VAARSKPFMPEGYALLYAEYRDGNYERAFTLSEEIDRERIEATVKDGVLRLNLPKTTPSPAKKIAVKPA